MHQLALKQRRGRTREWRRGRGASKVAEMLEYRTGSENGKPTYSGSKKCVMCGRSPALVASARQPAPGLKQRGRGAMNDLRRHFHLEKSAYTRLVRGEFVAKFLVEAGGRPDV
jgi:hypothetical protein